MIHKLGNKAQIKKNITINCCFSTVDIIINIIQLYYYNYMKLHLAKHYLSLEMKSAIWVQILNKAVYVLLMLMPLGKAMNPSFLLLAMGKK